MNPHATISVKQLARSFEKGLEKGDVELIDVRTLVEFRAAHIAGARNIPLDSLDPQTVMAERSECHEPLYMICQGGSRGRVGCQRFRDAGFAIVVNVEGGTRAWLDAGLPVVRGKKVLSLERQVRIAAGLLVLVGVALAILVNPHFIGLSAFVGAGLVFAGITDKCGMGLLLAKMPWNQVPPGVTVGDTTRTQLNCKTNNGSESDVRA